MQISQKLNMPAFPEKITNPNLFRMMYCKCSNISNPSCLQKGLDKQRDPDPTVV